MGLPFELTERWRPVPGFPGYQISDLGRVRSNKRGDWRLLAQDTTRDGHKRLTLRVDGKTVGRTVHRLVLEAFVGPCPEGMEACHNNGKADDNRAENLRWDTHEANIADKCKHGTVVRGERVAAAKLTESDVLSIRLSDEPNSALALRYGVRRGHVNEIKKGLWWRHVG